uniref:Uncharacterized protein n=1 Tax=Aegilops tauschii subsp. strangulata TaxID=200361 RepID=A0A453JAG8_AEGTS
MSCCFCQWSWGCNPEQSACLAYNMNLWLDRIKKNSLI